jgi:ferredoxin
MKIIMDWDLCQSHGVCTAEAESVFELDDQGNLKVLQESPEEALRANVEAAARYCPTQAIRISEE